MALGDRRCGILGALILAAWGPSAAAQTVFVCEHGGRAFVVAGPEGAPGCRALAEPERELGLAAPAPDLAALSREIARLSARIDRLEALITGVRLPRAAAPTVRQGDPFDTRGRTRDAAQDLNRRLEGR